MKKFVTTIVLLAGAASVYSQGQVNYSDYNPETVTGGVTSGFNIHVWSPQSANSAQETTGNSTTPFVANGGSGLAGDAPTGSSNPGFTGVMIGGAGTGLSATLNYANGDDFDVELYAGAGTLASFSQLAPIPGTLTSLDSGGAAYRGLYFPAGSGTLKLDGTGGTPTVAGGSPATFAIAAWFNGGGTYTTLLAAQGATPGTAPYGWSPVGTENVGGGTGQPPFLPGLGDTATSAGGITSFSLVTPTPEPSTIALGVIGASAFLMRLRRKQ
jgi:hypothetical protein